MLSHENHDVYAVVAQLAKIALQHQDFALIGLFFCIVLLPSGNVCCDCVCIFSVFK